MGKNLVIFIPPPWLPKKFSLWKISPWDELISFLIYSFFFFIKAFLAFTYKIETKKEKKEKNTHTHIVQIEEYQAKHTHKAITAIQLPPMQITMPSL